ncbi:MAG: class I SAM-dependent methyltransferase [Anaerolineae bacterium]|nr:class I SAM-dependent methyltransferase [Anaerolineae bacterium]
MTTANNSDAVRKMYITDEPLRIRQETHDRYSVPQINFPAWALDCVQWRGDETVLDVGCGPGRWYEAVQEKLPNGAYYGLDLYASMVRSHPDPDKLMLSDAQQLPFADATFDVVMANHMLFHVPDMEQAVLEFRRVLKPGGTFISTTNSIHNMPELQVLMRRAVTLLVPPGTTNIQVPLAHTDMYTLESGTRLLSRHFYAIVRYDLPSALVFPNVEPVLAYLESTRSVREPQLPPGISWDDAMMIVREQINRLIDHFGELVINKLAGVLIATDQGDFIREYLDHQTKTHS